MTLSGVAGKVPRGPAAAGGDLWDAANHPIMQHPRQGWNSCAFYPGGYIFVPAFEAAHSFRLFPFPAYPLPKRGWWNLSLSIF